MVAWPRPAAALARAPTTALNGLRLARKLGIVPAGYSMIRLPWQS